MLKLFIDIHDERWGAHKIDFVKIANVTHKTACGAMVPGLRRDDELVGNDNALILNFCEIAKSSSSSRRRPGTIAPQASEASLVLTNDTEIKELNNEYRGLNKPTNVLSFETGDSELLGDIYISYDTAMRESGAEEFVAHVTHLVIHGILHLLGHDHIKDSEAEIMEALEIKVLKKLGIKNPYGEIENTSFSPPRRAKKAPSAPPQGGGNPYLKTDAQNLRFEIPVRDCPPLEGGPTAPFSRVGGGLLSPLLFGALASFGFAPFNLWFLTLLGIGGAYYLISKKTFWPAFLFGAGYAAVSFWWVTNSIFVVPELAVQFAIWTVPAVLGIALVGGLVFSLPFIITNRCDRCWALCNANRPIVFAVSWTLVLWLREWLFTGFPWNPISNITLPFAPLANSMSLWGALGLTFVIVGLIAGAVEFIKAQKVKGKSNSLLIFSALLLIGTGYGFYNIHVSNKNANESPLVRIVQPAFSAEQKASHSREEAIKNAEENIAKLIDLARDGHNPDIVIFPETAYPYIIADDNLHMAKELGVTTLIGSNSYKDRNVYNSMIVANKDGKIEKIYSKSHLVPFGEYRPFGDIIPTPAQLTPGGGAEVININGLSFAPAICYEIVFSDSLVPNKTFPNAIVNITNDTWFGKTPGTYQHLDMVRRYAIESGLPVIRANYSGISAFVGADGGVVSKLDVGVQGTLEGRASGAHITPYRYIGRDGIILIVLLFSFCVMFATRRKV